MTGGSLVCCKCRHRRGVGIPPQPVLRPCSSSPLPSCPKGAWAVCELPAPGEHPQSCQSGEKAFSAQRAGSVLPASGRTGRGQRRLLSAIGSAQPSALGEGTGRSGEHCPSQFMATPRQRISAGHVLSIRSICSTYVWFCFCLLARPNNNNTNNDNNNNNSKAASQPQGVDPQPRRSP